MLRGMCIRQRLEYVSDKDVVCASDRGLVCASASDRGLVCANASDRDLVCANASDIGLVCACATCRKSCIGSLRSEQVNNM